MKIYKVVKKEEIPTIPLNAVKMEEGFLIVKSNDKAVGIIVYDATSSQYIMIRDFWDDFTSGIEPYYSNDDLEKLINDIKDDYTSPVEFNFIKIEE